MSQNIGIMPGAGDATRIGGFFKGLTPIDVDPENIYKFVVTSQRLMTNMFESDISPIYFVYRHDNDTIPRYFQNNKLFPENVEMIAQDRLKEYYGMPFAIDKIYENAKGNVVFLAMPDTIIEPKNAFKYLWNNFKHHNADLELGLFRTRLGYEEDRGGYIAFDEKTGKVMSHVDKNQKNKNFPTDEANNSWAIACWNGKFTEFLHKVVTDFKKTYPDSHHYINDELLFGDIIDGAIDLKTIKVYADYIRDGFYLDIATPKKYFDAIVYYHAKNQK